MSLPTLLLVDDDHEFLKAQTAALESEFKVVAAEGVHTGIQLLQRNPVDCILVDYYLNDGNGHEIASWVAQHMPWCPVLLISARLDKKMAVESFSHRIFDVIEKPYSLETVLSKVRAALRETKHKKASMSRQPGDGGWMLDRERRCFRHNGDSISLTSTEVKILETLINAGDKVVSREALVKAVWGGTDVAENTLDTHLTNLRKKAPCFKTMIKGIRGIGYVFEA